MTVCEEKGSSSVICDEPDGRLETRLSRADDDTIRWLTPASLRRLLRECLFVCLCESEGFERVRE